MKFLIGILLIAIGFLIIWKTAAIVGFAGKIWWAEQHLGTEGGTYLAYKLIGIAFIFLGLLAMTGQDEDFLQNTVGRLFAPSI